MLGHQHGVRRSDGAADDPVFPAAVIKAVHRTVITGPGCDGPRTVLGAQVAHDVTVRIEDADIGNRRVRHVLLTTGLPQQAFRCEGRGCAVVFITQDGWQNAEASIIHAHGQMVPERSSQLDRREMGGGCVSAPNGRGMPAGSR